MEAIDWSKQHCGVHQSSFGEALELMPDLREVLNTFPENPRNFTWDIKVHMLMPMQYPCIPNWHYDNIPRKNGIQTFEIGLLRPMYLWISGPPLPQFKHGFLLAGSWHRFTQRDLHRGVAASDFGWRGMIRATHKYIMAPKEGDKLRRHSQVYLDANDYKW